MNLFNRFIHEIYNPSKTYKIALNTKDKILEKLNFAERQQDIH